MADEQDTGDAYATGSTVAWSPAATPKQIGPYKILEQIGEGGMGTVYLAEQTEPIRRRVALKIIKIGMDSQRVIARFEAERQALAMLNHLNVATVFDAGLADDGRPYFVMELVPGEAITDYCDRHRLDVPERLKLFVQVCDAIEHAHQKGIIHRDVKPSNVLVAIEREQPVPKVIDFGVAKATSRHLTERTLHTEQGQLVGTPEYMSPEQAEMTGLGVDTRTDVYALGVLLYELLTGSLPFDARELRRAALGEILRIIREEEPPRPSTRLMSLGDDSTIRAEKRSSDTRSLGRSLRGDLDWITMKALEKDRTRRYATASALADDIARHLADEPVTAGRPSPIYRVRKYLKRHRASVAAGTGLMLVIVAVIRTSLAAVVAVMVVVTIGLGVAIWLYRATETARRRAVIALDEAEAAHKSEAEERLVAERARREAERQAEIARSINEFLAQMLASPVPWSERTGGVVARDVKIVDVLDAASERIDEALAEHPEVEAAVRTTLGQTYMDLGYLDKAARHLPRALDLRRRILGDEHEDTLRSMRLRGWLHSEQGSLGDAERLLVEAYESCLRALGKEHPETLDTMEDLAIQHQRQARYHEAQPLLEKVLEVRRRARGVEHPSTLLAMLNLVNLYDDQGRLDEAESLGVETLSIMRRVLGSDHASTAIMLSTLGAIYACAERWDEAEAAANEALETSRALHGEDHPITVILTGNVGAIYTEHGQFKKGEPFIAGAVARARATLPERHRVTAICLTHYGRCLTGLNRWQEAERALLESHGMLRSTLGPNHKRTTKAIGALVELYDTWGRPEQAAEWRAKLEDFDAHESAEKPNERDG